MLKIKTYSKRGGVRRDTGNIMPLFLCGQSPMVLEPGNLEYTGWQREKVLIQPAKQYLRSRAGRRTAARAAR